MERKSRDIIIKKILKYCDEINLAHDEYHHSFEVFESNPTYKNAIALCLLQIGELTGNLSDSFKDTYPQIPWKAIRGMRNVVAHQYGKIDVATVCETADSDIEELRLFCTDILNSAE